MNVIDLIREVEAIGNKNVTITGGEPLIHDGIDILVQTLLNCGFEVEIETNGTVDVFEFSNKIHAQCARALPRNLWSDESLTFTVDWKCPSSNMSDRMVSNFVEAAVSTADENNHIVVVKFVVGDVIDLQFARDKASKLIDEGFCSAHIILSPIFGKIKPADIVEYMKTDAILKQCRMQVQLHKIVWPPEMRGV